MILRGRCGGGGGGGGASQQWRREDVFVCMCSRAHVCVKEGVSLTRLGYGHTRGSRGLLGCGSGGGGISVS